ncbi:MAG: hypothetical protein PW789_10050 [Edaphobacter sp.]|uniref:cytochrome P460 family protein n=1 Tax=Edaphobacter sp. TaxID=1934404 RepID=UPI0023A1ECDA|nr:cytochrome P460 family protein [Edaphobacter sp.]MDE1176933.1 hypothetical protein [Edaphobacter sp.]
MNAPWKKYLPAIACGLLVLAGCNERKPEAAATNHVAALTGQLPYNPLAWKPITTLTNRAAATTSTLYGNDAAVAYARSTAGAAYPAGSVLALVTWAERDDPHWFGAKIPGKPQTVEFVSIGAQPQYAVYRGSPLAQAASDQSGSRIDFILHLRAAVIP